MFDFISLLSLMTFEVNNHISTDFIVYWQHPTQDMFFCVSKKNRNYI